MIALLLAGKAMAAIQGRDYVVPDDVKDVCIPALRHRMIRRPEAEIQGVSEVAAVQRAVEGYRSRGEHDAMTWRGAALLLVPAAVIAAGAAVSVLFVVGLVMFVAVSNTYSSRATGT